MSSELKVDTISEKTTASGVTIDSVLIKDGEVDGVDVSALGNGNVQTYTPTFTNFTLGNGTLNSSYIQIGKLVLVSLDITFGSTSSITSSGINITLPVAHDTNFGTPVSTVWYIDQGSALYPQSGIFSSGEFRLYVNRANTTYVQQGDINSTTPFTWTTNDKIMISLSYIAS